MADPGRNLVDYSNKYNNCIYNGLQTHLQHLYYDDNGRFVINIYTDTFSLVHHASSWTKDNVADWVSWSLGSLRVTFRSFGFLVSVPFALDVYCKNHEDLYYLLRLLYPNFRIFGTNPGFPRSTDQSSFANEDWLMKKLFHDEDSGSMSL